MLKIALALALATTAASASEITGPARVVDGDTVIVSGVHIRLKGVDAAELHTDLGEAAKTIMETIVAGGPLTCRLTSEKTWKREVGFCFTEAGVDINREIIEQGAALACQRYSVRYVQFETAEAIAVQQRAHYCLGRRR